MDNQLQESKELILFETEKSEEKNIKVSGFIL